MRKVVLSALLLFLCHGCTFTGLQGPKRTPEELLGKFEVVRGTNPKDLEDRLATGLGIYSVIIDDIQPLPDGGKKTIVKWSHLYTEVYSTTRKVFSSVWVTTRDSKGFSHMESRPAMVDEVTYHTRQFTVPCTTSFISHENSIDSYSSEGKGCVW